MTSGNGDRADVELRVPAESAFISVVRTTTAGLAARLDFTMEDIEDLRIAVGEASTLVLDQTVEGDLNVGFWLRPGVMTVEIAAPSVEATMLDEDSFAWTVLTSLASEATASLTNGSFAIRVTLHATSL